MTGLPEGADGLSIVRGIPLADEPGIGALTLGGYLREVADRYGPREAAVLWQGDQATRWSYDELLARSVSVARALVGCDVGKGTRVGILATNRLEFLLAVFGTALAGGVATTISTFYTASELDVVLRASGCSVLLAERSVLKKDFAAILTELEPALASGTPGQIASLRYPFLRHVVLVDSDDGQGAIEGWSSFLSRGIAVPEALVDAISASVAPSDPGILKFSSGSTGKAKGILSAHRGVCLQLWRWGAVVFGNAGASGTNVVCQRLFLVRQFRHGAWRHAVIGRLIGAAALVRCRGSAGSDGEGKSHLPQRLAASVGANSGSAKLSDGRSFGDALHRCDDTDCRHPTISTTWREPAQAFGNTETFTLISVYPSGTPETITRKSHGLPTAGSTIKIVEPLTGRTVPIGERGEIAVKGPTLMLGYLGIPLDETLDDEGFLATSDGGYVDADGRLFWEGRLNDIIKTAGANVSPLEIDAVIRECPGVKVSQTVGVPDELLGELVVGCIVPHAGAVLDEDMIRNFARQQLSSYKVPRRVLFFAEDELAVTGSAKIKTAELRKLASDRLASTKDA